MFDYDQDRPEETVPGTECSASAQAGGTGKEGGRPSADRRRRAGRSPYRRPTPVLLGRGEMFARCAVSEASRHARDSPGPQEHTDEGGPGTGLSERERNRPSRGEFRQAMRMIPGNRVVITAIGVLAPNGIGLDEFEQLFPDGYHRGAVKIAGLRASDESGGDQ